MTEHFGLAFHPNYAGVLNDFMLKLLCSLVTYFIGIYHQKLYFIQLTVGDCAA